MADTARRNAGEQIGYGYRQLPGAGPVRGPELKTLVCVGVGVFFGILAGTILADGSWRAKNPQAEHPVQISSSSSGAAEHAVTKAAQPAPLQLQPVNQGSQQLSITQEPAATQVSAAHKDFAIHSVSAAAKASATHKRRPAHRRAALKKHFVRRRAHGRHRPHVPGRAPVIAKLATTVRARDPANAVPAADAIPSAFTVQGDATVASFDASTGIMQTYEGEAFAFDKTAIAGGASRWGDFVSNIHYRCDQFWNCTLIRAGGVIFKAKRTK